MNDPGKTPEQNLLAELLLAIDSGWPRCAAAQVFGTLLCDVGYLDMASDQAIDVLRYDRVVVEIPTCRPDTPNPEDLIRIGVAGARLAERFARDPACITEYRPNEWKGNTPKPAHHARMWEALTPAERMLLGGRETLFAIYVACERGAKDRWRKPGGTYYRKSELPKGISHDILDAAALALFALGRIKKG